MTDTLSDHIHSDLSISRDVGGEKSESNEMYRTCMGIQDYALTRGEDTEALLRGVILETSNEIQKRRTDKDSILSGTELATKYGSEATALVTKRHMGSGLSVPRVILGGDYKLEDVIGAANCMDATIFSKVVLEEGFGIKSEIGKTRLGVVPEHHYLKVQDGSVIDPIIGCGNNRPGYFRTEEKYRRALNAINTGGMSVVVNQLRRILKGSR